MAFQLPCQFIEDQMVIMMIAQDLVFSEAGFCIIALMLSLLVFIGEAVRDAFDPRKVYR